MAEKRMFEHVIVLQNGASTHAPRSKKLIKELQKHFGKSNVNVINITGYNPTKIQEVIEQHKQELSEKTLIGIGGGDGTASSVVQAITTSGNLSKKQRSAALFPFWGGNANDLATMLNGSPTVSVPQLFERANIIEINPLILTFETEHGAESTRTAACYASFGATAEALWSMEGSAHARDRSTPRSPLRSLAHEFVVATITIFGFKAVKVQTDNKKVSTMYDRLFVNGSKFAKVLKTPVKLNDRDYYEIVSKKSSTGFFINAVRHFFKQGRGRVSSDTRKFIIKEATMAQLDGEIIGVQSNTTVEVGIHDVPFRAFSSKLKSQNGD